VHSVTDEYVPQLYEMSNESAINYVGNKKTIQSVFVAFSKFDCNNALLLGERGVGKTAIVKQMAQMIYHGEAPVSFNNHIIVNFKEGLHNLMQHFNEILNDAQERCCYIFFVPDIDLLIYDGSPYVDMVKQLLTNKQICVVATAIEERYNRVDADKHFPKLFKKIKVEEKTEEETVEIIDANKELYEFFHDVKYDDNIITECVKLTKQYVPNAVLPQTAIDIFDEVGALVDLNRKEDEALSDLKATLNELRDAKEQAAVKHDDEAYKAYSED
jgi:ATP-dependent Clp protease ATP-binding subunit ClpA